MAGRVRLFVDDDIPQVADLHRRVFGVSDRWSEQLQRSYRSYFYDVFLNNPWYDEHLSSLVYEESDGKIAGFLGVMPRPMWMRGRQIRAAVSSQFVVEPETRYCLAAVQLLKAFFSGPQDLSLADEANNSSRDIWERLGGSTALLYSIYWTCPLRPAQWLRAHLARRKFLEPLAVVSGPVCRAIDSVAARASYSPFYRPAARCHAEESDLETLLECANAFWHPHSLQPEYDRCSMGWLAERTSPTAVVVKNRAREVIGWFLYYLDRNRIGEVVQIASRKDSPREVLHQLFHHAWSNGAVALTGRLEPGLMPELWGQPGLFHHRRYWMLVHSRKPELLQAIYSGNAFLTRLEGEWCMRFEKSRYHSAIQ